MEFSRYDTITNQELIKNVKAINLPPDDWRVLSLLHMIHEATEKAMSEDRYDAMVEIFGSLDEVTLNPEDSKKIIKEGRETRRAIGELPPISEQASIAA